jgi:hypothetical protein
MTPCSETVVQYFGQPTANEPAWAIKGQRVLHPRYGEGEILSPPNKGTMRVKFRDAVRGVTIQPSRRKAAGLKPI